mmetsp:Transcript_3563/g.6235  ORF Transcript_3563/g.6235 Transcript_3563/m.6235 type:complete len:671 (-) Transcript_3563:242-2254(-)
MSGFVLTNGWRIPERNSILNSNKPFFCSNTFGLFSTSRKSTRRCDFYNANRKSKEMKFDMCQQQFDESDQVKSLDVPCYVVWGPPGVGKTQCCERLSHAFGVVHVSSGAILEAHVLYKTELGEQARPYMESKRPVPDNIVIRILLERLAQEDCRTHGFVCDGFPRTVGQDEALRNAGYCYRLAFVLFAPRNELIKRLRHRRIDPETKRVYNLRFMPPASQEVLERLVSLEDDDEDSIENTMSEYSQATSLVLDRVGSSLISINANRPAEDVFNEVAEHIEASGGKRLELDLPSHSEYALAVESDSESRPNTAKSMNGKPSSSLEKVPITLIRCDGYVCERESVDQSNITFRGAATEQVMLVWNERPKSVLLLTKKDPDLFPQVLIAARYLKEQHKMRVVVESFVQTEALANQLYLESFTQTERLHKEIDLVVCLGGDGLIMHVSTLFNTACPPVISFNLGSLGFLTPFDFDEFNQEIDNVVEGNCLMSLRMRLSGQVLSETRPSEEFMVLNEVVVDRGSSPYLSNLDCFCDDKYITTVQADGIIMSTPTGSTAYSMSAGGSMVHPSVPAILFTPICPHSLSFRPIIFPDSAKLRVDVSPDSRAQAWVSFDGKFRRQLKRGDGLLVQMSLYPVPTVNKTDHTGDWFGSLSRAFNFNTRGAVQKRLPKAWLQ